MQRRNTGAQVQVTPTADYPVRVRPRSWDEEEPLAELYADVYDVTLNQMVTVSFVPDLGPEVPPYDRRRLPADLDDIATPEQARLEAALFAKYVVTPNRELAYTSTRLPTPPWRDGPGGVVVYVTTDQFERFTSDLDELVPALGGLHSDVPISRLRGRPAMNFVEGLVDSPLFDRRDAYWLRDAD